MEEECSGPVRPCFKAARLRVIGETCDTLLWLLHACIRECVHSHTHLHTFIMHTCMNIHTHICMRTHANTCTHMHTHEYFHAVSLRFVPKVWWFIILSVLVLNWRSWLLGLVLTGLAQASSLSPVSQETALNCALRVETWGSISDTQEESQVHLPFPVWLSDQLPLKKMALATTHFC